MSNNKQEVIVTGFGGQGIIRCSDILAEVALAAGYDVDTFTWYENDGSGGFTDTGQRLGTGGGSDVGHAGVDPGGAKPVGGGAGETSLAGGST